MRERTITPTAQHEALRQDVLLILRKYEHLGAETMLAIASQVVGQLVALQDQRTMTSERAMEIVARNLEIGNATVIGGLKDSKGSA